MVLEQLDTELMALIVCRTDALTRPLLARAHSCLGDALQLHRATCAQCHPGKGKRGWIAAHAQHVPMLKARGSASFDYAPFTRPETLVLRWPPMRPRTTSRPHTRSMCSRHPTCHRTHCDRVYMECITCHTAAARNGLVEAQLRKRLEWLTDRAGLVLPNGTYAIIARYGNVGLVDWLWRRSGCPQLEPCLWTEAARSGSLAMLQWLRDRGCVWTNQSCVVAAKRDRLDVLQWMHAHGYDLSGRALSESAGASGRIDVIEWARDNTKRSVSGFRTMLNAAKRGHLDIVKWLHTRHGIGPTSRVADAAAHCANMTLIRWLVSERRCLL